MTKFSYLAVTVMAFASAAATTAARAESPTIDTSASQVWTSTKTRTAVQQELLTARADGSIQRTAISYDMLAQAPSVKTRSQVQGELAAARLSGELQAYAGEDSGAFYLSQQPRRGTVEVLAGAAK